MDMDCIDVSVFQQYAAQWSSAFPTQTTRSSMSKPTLSSDRSPGMAARKVCRAVARGAREKRMPDDSSKTGEHLATMSMRAWLSARLRVSTRT